MNWEGFGRIKRGIGYPTGARRYWFEHDGLGLSAAMIPALEIAVMNILTYYFTLSSPPRRRAFSCTKNHLAKRAVRQNLAGREPRMKQLYCPRNHAHALCRTSRTRLSSLTRPTWRSYPGTCNSTQHMKPRDKN